MSAAATRRNILRGLAAAPAVAVAVSALPAHAARDPDAEIIAAWKRWREAFALSEQEPDWSLIDAQEAIIHRTPARTPKGAAIKLWVALAHRWTSSDGEDACYRGDLNFIAATEHKCDWDERLLISALRSLEGMAA